MQISTFARAAISATTWSVLALLVACDSTTHYEYATAADIARDSSVRGRAVPPLVPTSATNIKGWYHVEMNQAGAEFDFDATDVGALSIGFHRAAGDELGQVRAAFESVGVTNGPESEYYVRVGGEYRTEMLAIDRARNKAYWLGKGQAK